MKYTRFSLLTSIALVVISGSTWAAEPPSKKATIPGLGPNEPTGPNTGNSSAQDTVIKPAKPTLLSTSVIAPNLAHDVNAAFMIEFMHPTTRKTVRYKSQNWASFQHSPLEAFATLSALVQLSSSKRPTTRLEGFNDYVHIPLITLLKKGFLTSTPVGKISLAQNGNVIDMVYETNFIKGKPTQYWRGQLRNPTVLSDFQKELLTKSTK